MPHGDNPAVEQLEEQLARISARLTRREKRPGGWLGLIGGLGLGALTGGALAYLLRSRQAEPPYIPPVPSTAAPRRADDAVVLRGTPTPASASLEQDDDEPILLKTPAATTPPAAPTQAAETRDRAEASPAAAEPTVENEAVPAQALAADEDEPAPTPTEPTLENEATPAPAVATAESEIAPAPVEPTVENEALPAAAIAEAPAETVATTNEADKAPTAEPDKAKAETPAQGAYLGSVAPVGDQCPPGYAIKGNRSRNGDLLYHTPTSNNFARTKPEACFATEEDAEAAGFRKARS